VLKSVTAGASAQSAGETIQTSSSAINTSLILIVILFTVPQEWKWKGSHISADGI
jgi:hypothetical protein